jgi:hypothetical protein
MVAFGCFRYRLERSGAMSDERMNEAETERAAEAADEPAAEATGAWRSG